MEGTTVYWCLTDQTDFMDCAKVFFWSVSILDVSGSYCRSEQLSKLRKLTLNDATNGCRYRN